MFHVKQPLLFSVGWLFFCARQGTVLFIAPRSARDWGRRFRPRATYFSRARKVGRPGAKPPSPVPRRTRRDKKHRALPGTKKEPPNRKEERLFHVKHGWDSSYCFFIKGLKHLLEPV